MWKIFGGFIAFAALALFIVFSGGEKLDMQGESGAHDDAPDSAHATAAVNHK